MPDDPFDVPDLPTLVRDKLAAGSTLQGLQSASADVVSYQRWGQLSRGERLTEFPSPRTLQAIAKALGITETTAVVAAAKAVGMNVTRRGSTFGQRMPASADALPLDVQRAVLNLLAALADHVEQDPSLEAIPEAAIEHPPADVGQSEEPDT